MWWRDESCASCKDLLTLIIWWRLTINIYYLFLRIVQSARSEGNGTCTTRQIRANAVTCHACMHFTSLWTEEVNKLHRKVHLSPILVAYIHPKPSLSRVENLRYINSDARQINVYQ